MKRKYFLSFFFLILKVSSDLRNNPRRCRVISGWAIEITVRQRRFQYKSETIQKYYAITCSLKCPSFKFWSFYLRKIRKYGTWLIKCKTLIYKVMDRYLWSVLGRILYSVDNDSGALVPSVSNELNCFFDALLLFASQMIETIHKMRWLRFVLICLQLKA